MHTGEPTIVLTAGDVAVDVYPDAGGRIGQITVAGQPLLIDVPAPADRLPIAWGMYPMAPWAGRIRHGRFRFEGVEHRLAINHRDGDIEHSIHGTVFDREWTVGAATPAGVVLHCKLAGALDWPFGGAAHQRIEVDDRRVVCELMVETARPETFPAEVGWHPWFLPPARLEMSPIEMYLRDESGVPTGVLVAPPPGPWDDCFTNTAPVLLHYERAVAPVVTVTSDCDHVVVFDQLAHGTCVEPQSGPPDAFNLTPHTVTPTTPLRRTMSISW